MIHLGDITQLHGDQIPVVDIITGGSPCQDLSVAGKRAGLDGERSGLFMEQIRIVKEMRERDSRTGRTDWLIRPRFMVWENVPGAFSSNKGKDFQAVLSEIVKIVEPDAPDVPLPDKGKWPKAGCLYSDLGDWSIAWRVHDAQFWGVPQRRKRIALVADFGGLTAPEILFERKGMSRDSEPCGEAWEGVAEATGGGVDSTGWGWHNGTYYMDADIEADPTIRQQGDCIDSTYPTVARSLTRRYDGSPCIDRGPDVVAQNIDSVFCPQGNGIDRADTAGCNGKGWRENQCYTLNTIDRPAVVAFKQGQGAKAGSIGAQEECSPTLSSVASGTNQVPAVVSFAQNQVGEVRTSPVSGTLNTNSNATGRNAPLVCDARGNGDGYCVCSDVAHSLKAKANCDFREDSETYVVTALNPCVDSVVRRLTPRECERLQGFPDGWTDIGEWIDSKGKKHKAADSPRYKALGNSIALPFWQWMARRICAQYERTPTMGSLFDGIGGFPLVFQRSGAVPVWASEIEEFPIAVTKLRFPEKE